MKKKGLIVATIVMVLVLAVSLTTATYAWFSSQASATVDDLQITTAAADGLQIAMTNTPQSTTGMVSGDLDYALNKWTGNDGWGSFLGFTAVQTATGQWEDAVAKVNDAGETETGEALEYHTGVYTVSGHGSAQDGVIYYVPDLTFDKSVYGDVAPTRVPGTNYYTYNGTDTYTLVSGALEKGTDYYTLEEGAFSASAVIATTAAVDSEGFYVPTGYDGSTNPTGFEVAKANYNYYELTMAITNTKDITLLGMGIVITPEGNSQIGEASVTNPAMAAATRIELEFWKGADAPTAGTLKDSSSNPITSAIEPFGSYKLLGNNTMDDEGYTGKSSSGNYQIQIDGAAEAGTVWFVTVRIWIEGTDPECKNSTAGSGYNVDIEFVYSNVTDGPVLDYADANEDSTANKYTVTF